MRASSWCLLVCAALSVGCGNETGRPTVVTMNDVPPVIDLPVITQPDAARDAADVSDIADASDASDADDADAALSCPQSLTACAGGDGAASACVDLQLNRGHCGMCGRACASGEVCSMGTCQVSCQEALTNCAGQCTNLQSDNRSCGMCGRMCSDGSSCVMGECQATCLAPISRCGGGDAGPSYCSDLRNDTLNCGRCGLRCLARQQCVEGRCTFACFAPLTGCPTTSPTVCVDPRWDPSNCGGCGRACSSERQCIGGSCCVPVGAVDQAVAQCPPTATCAESFVQRDGQSAAQGFQPSTNGFLVRARLRMANPYANRGIAARVLLVAAMSDADFTSPTFDLASATRASTELVGGVAEDWYDAAFLPPPAVMTTQRYYLVLQLPTFAGCEAPCTVSPIGPDMCNCPGVRWTLHNNAVGDGGATDMYPRGRAFSCAVGCRTWNLEPAHRDHVFEVYLSSMCM